MFVTLKFYHFDTCLDWDQDFFLLLVTQLYNESPSDIQTPLELSIEGLGAGSTDDEMTCKEDSRMNATLQVSIELDPM